ncbi:hypothetical protein RchiOBHm_Chr1g0323781 [Rosa chinensis]|uniref:Uncharacterized protein n=1 Tax=Rosa chinensis TaxID=74649 RepID=A0A2P6S9L6_ROSCH|nr:hypothetical protein RchiOBHm_Chr1g0323781 [Rosa chinensis]
MKPGKLRECELDTQEDLLFIIRSQFRVVAHFIIIFCTKQNLLG